jgi:recombination protein RecT
VNSNAVVIYQSPEEVRQDLSAMRQQLEEVLPSRMDPDRFLRVVAKAVIGNPDLMSCTRLSLLAAVHEAAQLGLEPSGLLGSGYLVPYKRNGVLSAQFIPGYRGLIDLARRSGEIEAIEADVVRLKDHFVYEKGTDARLEHRPFIPNPQDDPADRDPGPYVGAYMKATLRGGIEQYEWMTYDQIEAVRKRSRASNGGPWVTDWSEMARKTVVRRGAKYLPLTTEFRRALELDEEAEREAEPPSTVKMSKAAQMLLARSGKALPGEMTPETSEDTNQEENEAPGPSETATEGNEAEVIVSDATAICGARHPDATMGVCTRMPDHPAGHRSAEGAWPRGQK